MRGKVTNGNYTGLKVLGGTNVSEMFSLVDQL